MADTLETYQQLSPAELQHVADQFIGQFKGMAVIRRRSSSRSWTRRPFARVATQMHDYAKDHHPSILHVVSDYPVIAAAAVGVGLWPEAVARPTQEGRVIPQQSARRAIRRLVSR